MVRGAAGFVTDGGLRDGHVLESLPFATYASAVTITTPPLWGTYPPGEETIAAYQASLKSPQAGGAPAAVGD